MTESEGLSSEHPWLYYHVGSELPPDDEYEVIKSYGGMVIHLATEDFLRQYEQWKSDRDVVSGERAVTSEHIAFSTALVRNQSIQYLLATNESIGKILRAIKLNLPEEDTSAYETIGDLLRGNLEPSDLIERFGDLWPGRSESVHLGTGEEEVDLEDEHATTLEELNEIVEAVEPIIEEAESRDLDNPDADYQALQTMFEELMDGLDIKRAEDQLRREANYFGFTVRVNVSKDEQK